MLGLLAFFIYNGVYVLVNVEAEGRVSAMSIGKAFSGVGRGAEGLLYKKYRGALRTSWGVQPQKAHSRNFHSTF